MKFCPRQSPPATFIEPVKRRDHQPAATLASHTLSPKSIEQRKEASLSPLERQHRIRGGLVHSKVHEKVNLREAHRSLVRVRLKRSHPKDAVRIAKVRRACWSLRIDSLKRVRTNHPSHFAYPSAAQAQPPPNTARCTVPSQAIPIQPSTRSIAARAGLANPCPIVRAGFRFHSASPSTIQHHCPYPEHAISAVSRALARPESQKSKETPRQRHREPSLEGT